MPSSRSCSAVFAVDLTAAEAVPTSVISRAVDPDEPLSPSYRLEPTPPGSCPDRCRVAVVALAQHSLRDAVEGSAQVGRTVFAVHAPSRRPPAPSSGSCWPCWPSTHRSGNGLQHPTATSRLSLVLPFRPSQ